MEQLQQMVKKKNNKISTLLQEVRGKQDHIEELNVFLSQGTVSGPLSKP